MTLSTTAFAPIPSARVRTATMVNPRDFNVLNKTNLQNVESNLSSAAFGQIQRTYPARQIQLALKAHF